MIGSPLRHPALDVQVWPLPDKLYVKLDPERTVACGVALPDDAVAPSSTGTIVAVGRDFLETMVGFHVKLTPMSGVSLSAAQSRLQLPASIVAIEEGDILAVWDDPREHYLVDDRLPADSKARRWRPIPEHVLIRPHSPKFVRAGGLLIAEKNEKFARVWGHVLSVEFDLLARVPELEPGALVHYARYADELIDDDGRAELGVWVAPIQEIKAVLPRDAVEPIFV